ncbi:hypothetical protein B0J13DRAFT_553101 [Dactylonectria estremocensis]|uniref:Uncharacterized protein n=1 Tax=Dactylonectria estremocensis TaxID=1079267 RepID=A0A9P9J8D1_9HYPO|nr:hypothetical protein B0J13DRAFT_553101 [Dactylonectria estremocensis]
MLSAIIATIQAAGRATASDRFTRLIEARQQDLAFAQNLLQLLHFVILTLITAWIASIRSTIFLSYASVRSVIAYIYFRLIS